MQRVTIFGDIHGNLPALEAILADIEGHDTSPLYCLSDLVGYGTFPNEVIVTIRERNIATLMGNYDQGVGKNSDDVVVPILAKRQRHWVSALLHGAT